MKFGIIMDSDGHFQISKIEDREKTLELLKNISDGDYFADLEQEACDETGFDLSQEDLENLSENEYREWLGVFIQRGTFEIVEMD